MVAVVTILFALTVWVHDQEWPDWERIRSASWTQVKEYISLDAMLLLMGWWLFHAILHIVVPGRFVEGTKLRDGTHLTYKINALPCFLITMASCTLLQVYGKEHFGVDPAAWVREHLGELTMGAVILCILKAGWLYLRSFHGQTKMLAEGGNSGNIVYDFWMGRELNPRVHLGFMDFDLKYFDELRPGITAWAVLNCIFALQHYQAVQADPSLQARAWGPFTPEMWVVLFFQLMYIFDSQLHEENILTTMDVTTDGFGFMLVVGDLAWVPFVYSLQARFLAAHPIGMPWYCVAGIVAVCFFGMYIFRAANNEKDQFRKDPDAPEVSHLSFIQTDRGTRLIASSWWGMARHINYLGDWILAFGWCLATGFSNPIPYFFAVYFLILLVHRERRDDHKCARKYGRSWSTYTQVVPYRIIPGVY